MNAQTHITAAAPLITAPGAYADISNEDYHRNLHLLPEPSLSSSGAKKLLGQSPRHFWHDSPMNPDREPEPDKPHFNIGKAAHDRILLEDRWPEFYHVTPEGFSRAATKKFAAEIEEAEAAIESGITVLRHEDARTVDKVVAAIKRNAFAMAALTNGECEETLAWKDTETGIWCRARPDFRPNSIIEKRKVRIVADLKFVASTHASPDGFRRAIASFGYHQSAAFYWDGIKAVYGDEPTHWLNIVVEKEPPHTVSLYELPAEDIDRGKWLNRRARRLFADCMSNDRWPGYADEPMPVGLPNWSRASIDNSFDTSGE